MAARSALAVVPLLLLAALVPAYGQGDTCLTSYQAGLRAAEATNSYGSYEQLANAYNGCLQASGETGPAATTLLPLVPGPAPAPAPALDAALTGATPAPPAPTTTPVTSTSTPATTSPACQAAQTALTAAQTAGDSNAIANLKSTNPSCFGRRLLK